MGIATKRWTFVFIEAGIRRVIVTPGPRGPLARYVAELRLRRTRG